MIVKEEFLKKLRSAFDLNIYEVKLWTALLSRGVAAAGELSDISNVPRSRSYDVLESLEKKGFVIMKLGKPIKYIAVKPEEVIKRLKEHIKEKEQTRIDMIDKVKTDEIYADLNLLYTQGVKKIDPYSLAAALKGRDSIYVHLKSMLEKAEKSVTIVTTTQGLQRKIKRYRNLFKALKDKNVKIRIAAPLSENMNIKDLNEVKNNVQIKHLNAINARFVIVDDKEILFMISDDTSVHESYDTGVWVDSPFFVKAFVSMFNQTWNELSEKVNNK